jgi:hypothetical protein
MTTTTTTTTTKNATSLIERLSGNFAAEGKRSCRDCTRSKAMPSRRVLDIVNTAETQNNDSSMLLLSQSVLVEAHAVVTQRLADLNKNKNKNKHVQEASTTALSHMDTIAVAIRFIQLLLYLPQQTRQPLASHPSPNNSSSSMELLVLPSAALSPDRLDQLVSHMMATVVQSTAGLLSSSCLTTAESSSSSSRMVDEDNDSILDIDPMTMDASSLTTQSSSSSSYDARPVACFAFLSILRLQHFCKSRQTRMIPLTKGLCDLASVYAQQVKAPLPQSLLEDAIRNFTKLLDDGTSILANHAASRWTTNDQSNSSSSTLALDHHTYYARFLSFLVARIATLLSLLLPPCPRNAPPGGRASSTKNSATASLWKTLTTLRGLPTVILLRRRNSRQDRASTQPPQQQDPAAAEDASFVQNYSGIATKIEKQMLKLLVVLVPANKDVASSSSSSSSHCIVQADLIQALLDMKVKRSKSSDTSIQDLLRNARVLGRALLLQRMFQKVVSQHDPSTGGKEGLLTMQEDADILLQSCECYHSVVLPQCFGLLAASTYATKSSLHNNNNNNNRADDGDDDDDAAAIILGSLQTLLVGSLPILTTLLLQIENTLMTVDTAAKQSQFHRLLIRWMTPSSTAQSTTADAGRLPNHQDAGQHSNAMLHPLSQEFVPSLLYMYIMATSSSNNNNNKTTIPPPLVTLMVKLLFDARTTTELRWTLSTLIRRLEQASSTTSLHWMPTLATLVENEFALQWKDFSAIHKNIAKLVAKKKKRKRKGSNAAKQETPHAFHVYTSLDVEAIGRVLAQLPNRTHSPLIQDALQTLVREDVLKLMGQKGVSVQIKSISLLLWYMHSGMSGSDNDDSSVVVVPVRNKISVVQRMFEHVVEQLNAPTITDKRLTSYCPLIVASLSLCQGLYNNNNATVESSLPILGVCQMVSACTSESFLRPPRTLPGGGDTEETTLLRHRILFGGVALLGSMGKAIPDSCPVQALEVRFFT